MAEISALSAERDRLQIEKEVAVLRAEIRAVAAPWWRRASVITGLTTIVAGIVPATTAINGHFQKQREIAMEETKQAHAIAMEREKQTHAIAMEREKQTEQIRTAYLDRLKAPGEHLRTLRFVIATTTDPAMGRWAQDERKIVESELADLDKKIVALEPSISKGKTAGASSKLNGGSDRDIIRRSLLLESQLLEARREVQGPPPEVEKKEESCRLRRERVTLGRDPGEF